MHLIVLGCVLRQFETVLPPKSTPTEFFLFDRHPLTDFSKTFIPGLYSAIINKIDFLGLIVPAPRFKMLRINV